MAEVSESLNSNQFSIELNLKFNTVLRSKNDGKPQRKRQSRSENRKGASVESKQKRKEIRKSRLNSDTDSTNFGFGKTVIISSDRPHESHVKISQRCQSHDPTSVVDETNDLKSTKQNRSQPKIKSTSYFTSPNISDRFENKSFENVGTTKSTNKATAAEIPRCDIQHSSQSESTRQHTEPPPAIFKQAEEKNQMKKVQDGQSGRNTFKGFQAYRQNQNQQSNEGKSNKYDDFDGIETNNSKQSLDMTNQQTTESDPKSFTQRIFKEYFVQNDDNAGSQDHLLDYASSLSNYEPYKPDKNWSQETCVLQQTNTKHLEGLKRFQNNFTFNQSEQTKDSNKQIVDCNNNNTVDTVFQSKILDTS